MRCGQCGTEVPASRLSCPLCHALVHAAELKSLALAAQTAAAGGDLSSEISSWRRALDLLPPGSKQHEQIAAKVADLSRRLDAAPGTKPPESSSRGWKGGGILATLGLLAWKLKAFLLLLLTKGKLLLLGFTNAGTLLSMALSFGLYWEVFGWPFAAGLILSLYVHEMGHVAALHRLGMRASLPMFLPGIGAVVRLQQHPVNPSEDARIGLAGPIWGMGAALAAYLGFLSGGWPLLGAVARFGAWLNLFNLLPFWQLDGGRAFHALSRAQRITVALAMAALWVWTREGLLILLLVMAGLRAFGSDAPAAGDRKAILQYLVLLGVLSAMCLIPVPLGRILLETAGPACRTPQFSGIIADNGPQSPDDSAERQSLARGTGTPWGVATATPPFAVPSSTCSSWCPRTVEGGGSGSSRGGPAAGRKIDGSLGIPGGTG